ncbi:type II toxin-antitoxin system VapC family toxin [Gulosibacter bifidus]|uniref:Ribonuclease VapC n=1 Tax=Gulosibacter bifidus TaxID=272239 RepID=A0ABW5RLY7_9MICO|nr:type II toxin-antitoxin system VapC family toxin [Gulosibacter bifidus]
MIVLDTNVVSEVLRPRPDANVVNWLESITDDVAITAITLAELLAGLRRLPDGKRKSELSAQVETALRPYRDTGAILAFDALAAPHYADILAERQAIGLPISTGDAQIAAICRARGAVCATRNTKDFRSTGITLIDPWVGASPSAS